MAGLNQQGSADESSLRGHSGVSGRSRFYQAGIGWDRSISIQACSWAFQRDELKSYGPQSES